MKKKLTLLPLVLVAAPLFGGAEDQELTAWQMTDPIATKHREDLQWIDESSNQAALLNGTVLGAGLLAHNAQDHEAAAQVKTFIANLKEESKPLARGLDDERLYAVTKNSTHEAYDEVAAAAKEVAVANEAALGTATKTLTKKEAQLASSLKDKHSVKLHTTQAAVEVAEAQLVDKKTKHAAETNIRKKASLAKEVAQAEKALISARDAAVSAVVTAKLAGHAKPVLKEAKGTYEFKYKKAEEPVVEGPQPKDAPEAESKKPSYKEERAANTKEVTLYTPDYKEITVDGEVRLVQQFEGAPFSRMETSAEVRALKEEIEDRTDAQQLAELMAESNKAASADVLVSEIEAEEARIKALEEFAKKQSTSYDDLTVRYAEKVNTVKELSAPAEGKKGSKARKALKQATTARDKVKNEMGALAKQMQKKEDEIRRAKKNLARLQAAQNPSSGLLGFWGL